MIVSLQVKKLLALCVVNSVMCLEKNQQTTQKKAKVCISKSGTKEALLFVLRILLFYIDQTIEIMLIFWKENDSKVGKALSLKNNSL